MDSNGEKLPEYLPYLLYMLYCTAEVLANGGLMLR